MGRREGSICIGVLAAAALLAPAPSVAQDGGPDNTALPEIKVIGTTPLSAVSHRPRPAPPARTAPARPARGPTTPATPVVTQAPPKPDPTVIDRDKVPSNTQTLTSEDFTRSDSQNITDTLLQRVPGVAVSDPNGNSAQQEIKYRGFYASPLQGTPQGIAVYMNGIRLNEAFGDTVNWDLIPTNAIDRTDIWSNNPVFGLNALGGAVNIGMKNGFTYHGAEAEISGGSFGRLQSSAQFGGEKDGMSLYAAAQALTDKGWRQRSPAELERFYSDLGWRGDRGELHLVTSAAKSSFGVAAATPIQLLDRDWTSIYTTPQTTDNQMLMAALNGKYDVSDTWTVQGNFYVRDFRQAHVDGNSADLERCSNSSDPQFRNHVCLEDDGFPRPAVVTAAFHNQFAILDQNNNPIPCPAGAGNTCATVPYGTIDRTNTHTRTVGGSLQASSNDQLFGHDNHFTTGASIDHSRINFDASSELGYIFPDLSVGLNPAIPGLGSIIHTLGEVGYAPISLGATNTYYGVFATDTFDVTSRLAATFGARFNLAQITVTDLLGTSPDLNSSPTYQRLNPVAGLTYKLTPAMTVYGGYSESNRAPTPLELGCASSTQPCLLENFLVADPPLKQVVGRTYEAGLRGDLAAGIGHIEWKAGVFRTDSTDDIINVASAIQGRGFFQNVDGTRRQGIEAAAEYRAKDWLVYATYSFTHATYQFTGDLSSPNNPMADGNGNIHVVPGNKIPMIPPHQFKAGAEYAATRDWKVGAEMVAVSSQYFAGDDANQNEKLPAYWVANLYSSYQLNKNFTLFGRINNVFNRKYALYGTYFDPSDVANVPLAITLTDNRTEVPGQPLSIYVGLRGKL